MSDGSSAGFAPGFDVPDFHRPLDLDAELAAVSAASTTKGFMLDSIVSDLRERKLAPADVGSFIGFKDYPTRDYMRLAVQAAGLMWPDLPLREGIRRVGQRAYPQMVSTLIGRVVFGVLGKEIGAITRMVHKAYAISGSHSRATLHGQTPTSSHIRLDDVAFPDCLQVGAFEGVLVVCGLEGEVRVKRLGPAAVELSTQWWPRR